MMMNQQVVQQGLLIWDPIEIIALMMTFGYDGP
jgi:hypothetical protein